MDRKTKPISRQPQKAYVGMSGGVDSSVSAALLKKAGFDVTGVFIKVWQPDWIDCNWKEERLEAMRVAAHLDIPFVTLDLEKEYKAGVIDYMIKEYAAGRTPNPDVMCNREVKFGAFWKWANEQGAKYIATGHYARNISGELHVSGDLNKDQTYFLWTLTRNDLEHILFPIGDLTKPEVRRLANRFNLPNADKKDSQGLCFIGKVDVKQFLSRYIRSAPGDVLNVKGEIIGKHDGAQFLTIGERHGFTITAKTPNDRPYFIAEKDVANNTITVSASDSPHKTGNEVSINNLSWTGPAPSLGQTLSARIRYREELRSCQIVSLAGDRAAIKFSKPPIAPAPGQSLVLYNGTRCLGGGILV